MKKKAFILSSLIVMLFGLMISAQAQTQYRVNIPFDFNVGNKVFQAGDYVISLASSGLSKEILTIREAKSGKSKFVQVIPKISNEAIESSKLIFNRYEDQYYLAEMISPTIYAEFRRASGEERLAKMQKSKRETVAMKK